MKSVAKSLLLAFVGTGFLFWFIMMAIVPSLAVVARMRGDVAQRSVVVSPALFMRSYGIPVAAVAFLVFFAIAMYRFRKHNELASASRH